MEGRRGGLGLGQNLHDSEADEAEIRAWSIVSILDRMSAFKGRRSRGGAAVVIGTELDVGESSTAAQ